MMYYDKYYSKCVCVCGIVFCIANMFFFSRVFKMCCAACISQPRTRIHIQNMLVVHYIYI